MPNYSIKKENIKETVEESCFYDYYEKNIKLTLNFNHKTCSSHYPELKKQSLYSSVLCLCRCIDDYLKNDFDVNSEEMILTHDEMLSYTFIKNSKGTFNDL